MVRSIEYVAARLRVIELNKTLPPFFFKPVSAYLSTLLETAP